MSRDQGIVHRTPFAVSRVDIGVAYARIFDFNQNIMRIQIPPLNFSGAKRYDKEGLMPFVERTSSGTRWFKESDIEALKVIECLKSTGMPIKEIKSFIDWCSEEDAT